MILDCDVASAVLVGWLCSERFIWGERYAGAIALHRDDEFSQGLSGFKIPQSFGDFA
jgi:hypothetical protein